jgi:hypothetical protein
LLDIADGFNDGQVDTDDVWGQVRIGPISPATPGVTRIYYYTKHTYTHTQRVRAQGREREREMAIVHGDGLQQPAWFLSLAALGAAYLAAAAFRLLAHLARCLGQPADLRRRYGPWAVVTGPTLGISRSMALELARRGLNLVLVGRVPAKLKDVSDAIFSAGGAQVQTKTVVFDLALASTPQGYEAARRLLDAVNGLDVGVVVNNAGVAKPCAMYLHEADVEVWVWMVRVDLWALTEVTAAVLPGMARRRRSRSTPSTPPPNGATCF